MRDGLRHQFHNDTKKLSLCIMVLQLACFHFIDMNITLVIIWRITQNFTHENDTKKY